MGDRLPKVAAGLTVALGLAAIAAGAGVFVEAWQTSQAWAGSPEAQQSSVPSEEPIWLDAPALEPQASGATDRTQPSLPSPLTSVGPPQSVITPIPSFAGDRQAPPNGDSGSESAIALASPAEVEVAEVDFRFLDPPEPGAHARLAVSLVNRAAVPTAPFSVSVPGRWLQGFEVFGAVPDVLDDRQGEGGDRRFVFDGLAPGARQTVEVHVLSRGEEIDAPEVRVTLGDDAEIGRAHPRTVAPRPRPGPARAVAIPRLGVRASVVPVPWEPPPFVVGQLQGTAAVTLGNTVLIGHLAGPAGDVFARLDRLRPGDEVVATSRGLEYRFVVSEIAVRPYDDVLPAQSTETPRLTLMTCTGQWSIARQDYSHRLWVVAEPPELAEQTIRANAARAAEAAREAEAAAAARATHEAEAAVAAGESHQAETAVSQARSVATEAAVPSTPAPAETPISSGVVASMPVASAVAPDHAATTIAVTLTPNPGLSLAEGPAPDATDQAEPLAPGITIDEPVDASAVATRVLVRGRRTAEADAQRGLWLVVRAEIEGSRWYALDRPLEPDKRGGWQVEVALGGSGGIRHEIRVIAVDERADVALRRHTVQQAGQPLDDLPDGSLTGARVVVVRG